MSNDPSQDLQETPEELLQEALVEALKADAFFIRQQDIRVISRKVGDVESKVEELLSSVGAGVLVRTPLPASCSSRYEAPVMTSYKVQVLIIERPMIASASGLPSAARLAFEVGRALNGFKPAGDAFPKDKGQPWTVRLDPGQPREDVSPDDSEIRYLVRFNYQAIHS